MARDHELPHSLVPLALAVVAVRSKLAPVGSAVTADADGMAAFIAAVVPIWEYSGDAARPPRALLNPAGNGIFKDGGRELRFLDGRPSKHLLAVHADDIGCVIEMIRRPDSAVRVRARVLRALAKNLVRQSRSSVAASKARRDARPSRRPDHEDAGNV